MHIYNQKTGMWSYSGKVLGVGYSGAGQGKNNPNDQAISNVGPIPVGFWHIGEPHDDPHTGPFTMNLDPSDGDNTFGRSLFRLHGDNVTHTASHGCIIMDRNVREAIWLTEDKMLQVISS